MLILYVIVSSLSSTVACRGSIVSSLSSVSWKLWKKKTKECRGLCSWIACSKPLVKGDEWNNERTTNGRFCCKDNGCLTLRPRSYYSCVSCLAQTMNWEIGHKLDYEEIRKKAQLRNRIEILLLSAITTISTNYKGIQIRDFDNLNCT